LHAQKRYVEDVDTQRQLQVDELPRLVSDYNARKHHTIDTIRQHISRDRRKTLEHGVQRDKNHWSSKIQWAIRYASEYKWFLRRVTC